MNVSEPSSLSKAYIDLLKASLRNTLYEVPPAPPTWAEYARALSIMIRLKLKYRSKLPVKGVSVGGVIDQMRGNLNTAYTLADSKQIENVQFCVETVLKDGVKGDLIETGVFRGGQVIFMRGLLKAYGVTDRKVFVADSFEGLPTPKETTSDLIAHDFLEIANHFRATLDDVRANFARFGLLDNQVHFLKGWFADTLPTAPIAELAVMRLDGDYYESTMDALNNLYHKLSVGGFVIIDDYGHPVGCRQAVTEFRERHRISDPLQDVNGFTAYWRRTA